MNTVGGVTFAVGLVPFSLAVGNTLGLIYPPQISTNFRVWAASLFGGIALMGTGIYLMVR